MYQHQKRVYQNNNISIAMDATNVVEEVEVWKEIIGSNGRYKVSNLGRVKAYTFEVDGAIMKGSVCAYGYRRVIFSGKVKGHPKVHRLVAMYFIDNPDNKPLVNHIDGNKLNNRADNLEWCTSAENIRHAYSTGLSKGNSGEINGNAKLTQKQANEILEKFKSGLHTRTQLATEYGVSKQSVGRLVLGVSFREPNITQSTKKKFSTKKVYVYPPQDEMIALAHSLFAKQLNHVTRNGARKILDVTFANDKRMCTIHLREPKEAYSIRLTQQNNLIELSEQENSQTINN